MALYQFETNARDKFPIELLFESDAVLDSECIEYTEIVFRLLKVYPVTLRNVGTQMQSELAEWQWEEEKVWP